MIINTGSRTDIPAYYSEWFYNRIREGYVMVRNPYYPQQVTKYVLDPEVVDALVFCTKNPAPMLDRIHELDAYRTYWHVTITPYGKDIEPNVPDVEQVIDSFVKLSEYTGKKAIAWRYDPIFLNDKYTIDYHIRHFERMAKLMKGYTTSCVVSFIDLYEKTKKNFSEVRTVPVMDQQILMSYIADIAGKNGMKVHLCLEDQALVRKNVDADGCFTQKIVEEAIGQSLTIPGSVKPAREGCNCLLGGDIGVYNTCGHACRYCYANYDMKTVKQNMAKHDPDSPFLIGRAKRDDVVKDAKQQSWIERQMTIFDFM